MWPSNSVDILSKFYSNLEQMDVESISFVLLFNKEIGKLKIHQLEKPDITICRAQE